MAGRWQGGGTRGYNGAATLIADSACAAPPMPMNSTDALPRTAPLGAVRTLARIRRYVAPYRREVTYAAIALVIAAAAVLAVGQGLRGVIDHGFSGNDAAALDR